MPCQEARGEKGGGVRGTAGQRGFLLVEILIALVVASVGLLAIARLQVRLEAEAAYVRHHAEALRIARGRLDRLRFSARRPATSRLGSGRRTIGPPDSGSDEERPGLERRYRCRWRVEERPGRLRAIEVEVGWNEPPAVGGQATLVLRTLVMALPIHRPMSPP